MQNKFQKIFENSSLMLFIILALAILLRIFFFMGHIFSDDAYYGHLAFIYGKSNLLNNYLGYPIFPIRVGHILTTSLFMMIFQNAEFGSVAFPFLISILNIVLVYRFTILLTNNNRISLLAAFILSIIPTEIIFASLNFPDAINVFFLNLGIYFLFLSIIKNKLGYSFVAVIPVLISGLYKEYNIYYIVAIIIVICFLFFYNKNLIKYFSVFLSGLILFYLLEGAIYFLINGDFFYRINLTERNYQFCFYDFYPYKSFGINYSSNNSILILLQQIFFVNFKSIFLRRFYLFIPLFALLISLINLKKKQNYFISIWFLLISTLLISFTTSLSEFKPLDLTRSWYAFPLFLPASILLAIAISEITRKYIKMMIMLVLSSFSIVMSYGYQGFFQKNNIDQLKSYLKSLNTEVIYTDHFTKYSVDIIKDFKNTDMNQILTKEMEKIKPKEKVIINEKIISELKLQGFNYPQDKIISDSTLRMLKSIGDYKIYEKK